MASKTHYINCIWWIVFFAKKTVFLAFYSNKYEKGEMAVTVLLIIN